MSRELEDDGNNRETFNLNSWNDLEEGRKLLGFETSRSHRHLWHKRLLSVKKSFQLRPRNEKETHAILNGGCFCWKGGPPKPPQRSVRYLLSSTFTDTAEERNHIIADVIPYLEEYARAHKVEHAMVEMRWGIREEDSSNHQTVKICLQELERCKAESAGISYILLACQKYGFVPIPHAIKRDEFLKLVDSAPVETALMLQKYYRLDENSAPQREEGSYKCAPSVPDEATECEFVLAGGIPWQEYEKLHAALQDAVRHLWPKDCTEEKLSDPRYRSKARKYFVSVTEMEVENGLFAESMAARLERTFVFGREFRDIPEEAKEARLFQDMREGKVVETARALLEAQHKHIRSFAEEDADWEDRCWAPEAPLAWGPGINAREEGHREYMQGFLDKYCAVVADSIDRVAAKAQVEEDAVADEARQHLLFAHERVHKFFETAATARVALEVKRYLRVNPAVDGEGGGPKVLVIVAPSGGGKTCLMAKAVKMAVEGQGASGGGSTVVRFLGTSPDSARVHQLLVSLVGQLRRVYGGAGWAPSQDWRELVGEWRSAVGGLPSAEEPLVLLLDSLDQLDESDGGRTLEWLLPVLRALPPCVRVVLSTLPDTAAVRCHSILREALEPEGVASFLWVDPPDDAEGFFKHLMAGLGRAVNEDQLAAVNGAMCAQEAGATPLWLTVASHAAEEWKSFDAAPLLASSVPAIIEQLLARLEARHGRCLVEATLSYLRLARDGLSGSELRQILNCEDAVLADVFEWWLPPLCMLPPLLVQRLLHDLSRYLNRRGDQSGQTLITLYHRQFFLAADTRYLLDPSRAPQRCAELADFFSGRWAGSTPKPCSPALLRAAAKHLPAGQEAAAAAARDVLAQPLMLREHLALGCRHAPVVNARRVHELVHQQLQAGGAYALQAAEELCSIDYVAAKMAARDGPDLLREYSRALSQLAARVRAGGEDTAGLEERLRALQAGRSFVGRHLSLLQKPPCPSLPFQLALAEPDAAAFCRSAHRSLAALPAAGTGALFVQQWPAKVQEADPARLRVLEAARGVTSARFLPDGEALVLASQDLTLKLVRTLTGEVAATLKGHQKDVRAVAVSPQHRQIASVSNDRTMRVWSFAGKHLQTLEGHQADVRCCQFSAAGGMLASSSNDKSIRIYAQSEGAPGRWELCDALKEHTNNVTGIAFSTGCDSAKKDSRWLASCSGDTSVLIWDLATRSVKHRCMSHSRGLTKVAFHPTDRVLASAAWDNLVKLWCVATGALLCTLPPHTSNVTSVSFSPCGRRLLSAVGENLNPTISLWQISEPQPTPPCPPSVVTWSSAVRRWSAEARLERRFRGHTKGVTSVAFNAQNSSFVSASSDCSVTLWDLDAPEPEPDPTAPAQRCSVAAVAFAAAHGVVATCDKPPNQLAHSSIRLWNVRDGTPVTWGRGPEERRELAGHAQGVTALGFHGSKQWLVSGSWDGTAVVWDWGAGEERFRWGEAGGDYVRAAAFSPDGAAVALARGNGVCAVRASDGAPLWELPDMSARRITSLAFHPDGRLLAAGSRDGAVRFLCPRRRAGALTEEAVGWAEAEAGMEWRGHQPKSPEAVAHVLGIAFSHDGQLAAALTGDPFAHEARVHVFEAAGGAAAVELEGRYASFAQPAQVGGGGAGEADRYLLAVAAEALVYLHELRRGRRGEWLSQCVQACKLPQRASALGWAGDCVVVGCTNGQIVCLQAGAVREVCLASGGSAVEENPAKDLPTMVRADAKAASNKAKTSRRSSFPQILAEATALQADVQRRTAIIEKGLAAARETQRETLQLLDKQIRRLSI